MKQNNKLNILVTGVGGPAGVNVCALLKKQGSFTIFGTDINPYAAGQFMCEHFALGKPVADEEAYLAWIAEHVTKNRIAIIVPTVAEELVLVDKLHAKLDEVGAAHVRILASNPETLALCDEKDKLYAWTTEHFPQYIGRWQRLDKKIAWDSPQYFIKPVKGRGSRGCRLVTKDELEFLITHDTNSKNMIAMEVLPGKEWTVDAYVNEDGSFAYLVPRLRLALAGGISQIGRTDSRADVIKVARDILSTLKCRGPVFIQLKEDKNGMPKMVEVNPRASGGLMITALAGADFAACLKAEYVDNQPLHDVPWKEVTVTRYFENKIVL